MSNYDNLENKFKSPELNKKKPNNKALATMLAIALASSSLVGCGETDTMLAAVEEVTNPQVTNELSAETSQQTPEAPDAIIAPKLENAKIATEFSNGKLIDYSEYPENLATDYNTPELAPESQKWIAEVDAMSLEDFEKLPEQDQLRFAHYVFKNNKPGFDERLKLAGVDVEYVDAPTERKQIVERLAYVATFLGCGLYTMDKDNKDAGLTYDYDMANKLKSLYISKFASENDTTNFSLMIDAFRQQWALKIQEFKIDTIKSANMEIGLPDTRIANAIVADIDFVGSDAYNISKKKQVFIILTPITNTISGDDFLLSQALEFSSEKNAIEIKED